MAACCQILEARRHFKDASSTQELQTQQELPSVSWRKRRLIRAVKRENWRRKKSVVASDARPGRISCAFAESSVSAMRAQILRIGYCFVNLESRASQPGESTASLDQSPMSKRTRWPVRPSAGPVRGPSGSGTLPYQFFRIISAPGNPARSFASCLACQFLYSWSHAIPPLHT